MSDAPLIPLFDVQLEQRHIDAVADTLRSGWLTMGPRTQEFERVFAEHLDCKHAIALANCTAALHLAYLAAGVGPGDEVVVPAITFVATAAAASGPLPRRRATIRPKIARATTTTPGNSSCSAPRSVRRHPVRP